MKFKIKKIILLILFVISIVITFFSVKSTLGKYNEEVNTSYQVGIRKWFVVVNGEDIQNDEKTLSQILLPTILPNEHIKSGVLVPGAEGYFEMDLDFTKVDVPFVYNFEMYQTNEATKQLADFEFFGYQILEEASGFEFDSTTNTISYIGIEEVDDDDKTETIDENTGDKTLEIVQTVIDAETGATKEKILTATLTTPETPEGETDFIEVGKVSQVTKKVIDADTGFEIEAEKVLFRLAQEYDETNKKTRFKVIQAQDPTKLEVYERYQNLGVYFRWNDSAANQMDNYADTTFRGADNPDANIANTLLKYQGNLQFKQFVESDLTPVQVTPIDENVIIEDVIAP